MFSSSPLLSVECGGLSADVLPKSPMIVFAGQNLTSGQPVQCTIKAIGQSVISAPGVCGNMDTFANSSLHVLHQTFLAQIDFRIADHGTGAVVQTVKEIFVDIERSRLYHSV
jgi:hypothetical protein